MRKKQKRLRKGGETRTSGQCEARTTRITQPETMKTMLFTLTFLAFGIAPAAPVAASAADSIPEVANGLHRHYFVHYRTCPHDPCQIAGPYDCLHDAEHAASHLQTRGYIVERITSQ